MSAAPETLRNRAVCGQALDPSKTRKSFTDKQIKILVVAAASLLSIAATTVVFLTENLAQTPQGDVFSHLFSARRVTDSLTPGFAQIGQYWPPLFHVIELPFTMIGPLYRSGLAGAIPSMIAYVVGVWGAYELGVTLTGKRGAGLFGAAAFALNPSLLYLQSIPMLESTITATLVWSAASLAGFARRLRTRDALIAGAWVTAAGLSHYSAWMVIPFGALVILGGCYRARLSRSHAEFSLLTFGLLPVFSVVLWLAWGYYIQDNPLFFASTGLGGETVPELRMAVKLGLAGATKFLTGDRGNLAFAILNYGLTVLQTIGPVALIGCLGFMTWALVRRRFFHPLITCAVAGAFVVSALFLFGGALGSPVFAKLSANSFPPAATENVRYGIYLLPLWAGVMALIGAGRRALPALALVGSLAWFSLTGNPFPTREDQIIGYVAQARIADYLQENYNGGRILASSFLSGDRIIWLSKINSSEFVTESNSKVYQRHTARPQLAKWVLVAHDGGLSGRYRPESLSALGFDPKLIVDTNGSDQFRYMLWKRRS